MVCSTPGSRCASRNVVGQVLLQSCCTSGSMQAVGEATVSDSQPSAAQAVPPTARRPAAAMPPSCWCGGPAAAARWRPVPPATTPRASPPAKPAAQGGISGAALAALAHLHVLAARVPGDDATRVFNSDVGGAWCEPKCSVLYSECAIALPVLHGMAHSCLHGLGWTLQFSRRTFLANCQP